MLLVQRKGWHANKILLAKKERRTGSIVDRDCQESWSLLVLDKERRYIPGLSKSTQLGSLLSYHSEEATAPVPPKAFMFFFGVTGTNMLETSAGQKHMR